ncbi:hypothetical protein Adt_31217 [Abeliophyllum distichum]|uniref:Uncharacterized protein n=1 Tax=Abeliophyllum distichum TaxID=126358 RepID=A0ABD1RET8_9LAMI
MEDTIKGGGPSILSEKFSNGTSTMNIEDKSFDDPDSDDEAKAICRRIQPLLVMAGNHFSKIHVFKIRGEKLVDEKKTLFLRPITLSTVSTPASTVPLVVQMARSVSSFLPTLNTMSISAAIIPPTIGVVGDYSSSVLFETSMNPLVDVQYQDKGKWVVVDEGEKVVPKRSLKDEGDDIDFVRVKRGRMALHKKNAKSIPTSPSAAQGFFS